MGWHHDCGHRCRHDRDCDRPEHYLGCGCIQVTTAVYNNAALPEKAMPGSEQTELYLGAYRDARARGCAGHTGVAR